MELDEGGAGGVRGVGDLDGGVTGGEGGAEGGVLGVAGRWKVPRKAKAAARPGATARMIIRAEELPPTTKPAVRSGPRGLRTETVRRRGVVVLKFAGGGGVGDRGVDFARAAVGRGELDGVVAGNEMGGDRGSERSGAGEGEGADVGEGRGKRGGADPVGVFARAIGAGEKFGAGAGGERAGDAEGGLGGAADDGFFPGGDGVVDDVAEAERVAGRGEVGEEREVGKEAPSSLQATLSVDGTQRVGKRREMKRPLRSRRVLGVVERALPAA